MRKICLLLCFLICNLTVVSGNFDPVRFPEPYCGTRAPGTRCCCGRNDDCSMPIHHNITRCYCDTFCEQHINHSHEDCCPDFRRYKYECPKCTHSRVCSPGDTYQQDCNQCTCSAAFAFQYKSTNYQWKCTQSACINDPKLIAEINSNSYRFGWTATAHNMFAGLKVHEGMTYFLGTLPPTIRIRVQTPIAWYQRKSFDARERWPNLIQPAADQGRCAASWAFSTASVAADRWAIQTKGYFRKPLSVQELISCNNLLTSHEACRGGRIEDAWWWLQKKGVVSDDCYPYTSGFDGSKGTCQYREQTSYRSCLTQGLFCQQKMSPFYRIKNCQDNIMAEIYTSGPVQALMKVRPDFFLYKKGVYRYTHLPMAQEDAYHSVKLIGWGVEQGINYWLAVNSWGPTWGEDGTFKIVRGRNESGIEEFVLAARARASSYKRH